MYVAAQTRPMGGLNASTGRTHPPVCFQVGLSSSKTSLLELIYHQYPAWLPCTEWTQAPLEMLRQFNQTYVAARTCLCWGLKRVRKAHAPPSALSSRPL